VNIKEAGHISDNTQYDTCCAVNFETISLSGIKKY